MTLGGAQVETLLAARANIEATNSDGWTALHWACSCGAEAVARRLLLAGAVVVSVTDDGSTPLSLAQEGGHEKLCLLLDVSFTPSPPASMPVSPHSREPSELQLQLGASAGDHESQVSSSSSSSPPSDDDVEVDEQEDQDEVPSAN